MRLLAFVPLVALLALVAVNVFLLTREGDRERFTEGMVGQPVPAYALARLDGGEPLTGEQRRGRAYVINLFASWWTPCRVEHPQLVALRRQGGATGTLVIAKATATVLLSNMARTYTGGPLQPVIGTNLTGLATTLSGVPQTNVGSYPFTVEVTDPNYVGSASGTFTIGPVRDYTYTVIADAGPDAVSEPSINASGQVSHHTAGRVERGAGSSLTTIYAGDGNPTPFPSGPTSINATGAVALFASSVAQGP